MAFVRKHAVVTGGELAVFWDPVTATATKVILQEGEEYAPKYPSTDSIVIFAGGVDNRSLAMADEQIAKWQSGVPMPLPWIGFVCEVCGRKRPYVSTGGSALHVLKRHRRSNDAQGQSDPVRDYSHTLPVGDGVSSP